MVDFEDAEMKDPRKVAREEDVSRDVLESDLKELGFRRLEDFTGKKNPDQKLLEYHLDSMEKKKIQGMFGEKISVFVRGKIKRFISRKLSSGWEIHENLMLRTENDLRHLRFGEKPGKENGIKLSGSSVAHYGAEDETLRERIRRKHFSTSGDLFQSFQENQVPSIDETLYAVKKKGKRKFEYDFIDYSTSSAGIRKKKQKVEIDHVEDFKIVAIEVKTTDRDAEKLLSEKQRNVRDRARKSPFLDFYTVKVDFQLEDSDIPTEVPVEIEKK